MKYIIEYKNEKIPNISFIVYPNYSTPWLQWKEIFTYQPQVLTTSVDTVLTYLNRVVKRHAIVFLISDCLDTGFDKSLRLAAKKHDLTVIRLSDPAEEELPDLGLVTLRDPETGEVTTINTGSRRLRQRWRQHRKDQTAHIADLVRNAGVDLVELTTDGPVVEPLTRFFDVRRKRQ